MEKMVYAIHMIVSLTAVAYFVGWPGPTMWADIVGAGQAIAAIVVWSIVLSVAYKGTPKFWKPRESKCN